MLRKRQNDDMVEVNMTPIIDMVFLLLIFFLVATKFADIERDVRIKPASSRHARPVTEVPQELVVNVTRDGQFLVQGKRRSMEEIDGLLRTAKLANPRQSVVVRGDRDAVLQSAVVILDLCEKHHIEKTFLTTSKVAEGAD